MATWHQRQDRDAERSEQAGKTKVTSSENLSQHVQAALLGKLGQSMACAQLDMFLSASYLSWQEPCSFSFKVQGFPTSISFKGFPRHLFVGFRVLQHPSSFRD